MGQRGARGRFETSACSPFRSKMLSPPWGGRASDSSLAAHCGRRRPMRSYEPVVIVSFSVR